MEIKVGKVVANLFKDRGFIDEKTDELYLSFEKLGNFYVYSENDDHKKFIHFLIKKNFNSSSSVKLIIVDDTLSFAKYQKEEFMYDKRSYFTTINENQFSINMLQKLLNMSKIRVDFNESKSELKVEEQDKAFVYKNLNQEILVVFTNVDKYLKNHPNDLVKLMMIMKFSGLTKIHLLFGSNEINEKLLKLFNEEDTIITFKTKEKETSEKLVNNFNANILKDNHFLILNKNISVISEEMELSE